MNQRVTIAVLAGDSADFVSTVFGKWRKQSTQEIHLTPKGVPSKSQPDPQGSRDALDHIVFDSFCSTLREKGYELPIVHFTEWSDRWLMGDELPGPYALNGKKYQMTVMTCEQAMEWAEKCGSQFEEQVWFATRLREAAEAWEKLATQRVVVVIREVFGLSTDDEEVKTSMNGIPDWLEQFTAPASPR